MTKIIVLKWVGFKFIDSCTSVCHQVVCSKVWELRQRML